MSVSRAALVIRVALVLVAGLLWGPGGSPATAAPPDGRAAWRMLEPTVPGPFVDVISDVDENIWLSSPAVSGFIRLDERGRTKVFPTPDFTPSYFAVDGNDGRVYATSGNRPRTIGALTGTGQLTVYVLPHGRSSIPASKPSIAGTNWVYYASLGQIGFLTPELFAATDYPSGLKDNTNIATTADAQLDFWATECCLHGRAGLAEFTREFSVLEFPLPAACAQPAGLTAGQDGKLYVPCSRGKTSAVLIAFANGQTTSIPLAMPYLTRVNTIAAPYSANHERVYFTPGSSPALWAYDLETKRVLRIPTPDGSVPTAVESTDAGLCVISGANVYVYNDT